MAGTWVVFGGHLGDLWLARVLLDAVGMGPDFDSRLAKSVGAFCDCRFIPYVGRVVQQLPVEGKDSEMR
jgi:hypothetical protein